MNRGRRPQREEGRKKREGGEQQHSAALPSHFSHGRSHEKLHREATFKRSNDDYVKFCPAILPTHTPSTSRVASFFNSDAARGVQNRFHRSLEFRSRTNISNDIEICHRKSRNSILSLSLDQIRSSNVKRGAVFIRNSIKFVRIRSFHSLDHSRVAGGGRETH